VDRLSSATVVTMSAAYGNMGRTQYSNNDIMDQMQASGWRSGAPSGGYGHTSGAEAGYHSAAPHQNPGSYMQAMDGYPQYPSSYAGGLHSGGEPQTVFAPGFGAPAEPPGYKQPTTNKAVRDSAAYEGEMRYGEKRVVSERMTESGHEKISGVRDIFTREKVVEVPQIYTKESTREVFKPEIIERIIEVPAKTEIRERHIVGPSTVRWEEQIIETFQEVVEERVVHVTGPKQIVERLIEVPKVDWVERIEYDDYIEYREVPVDKFVEVPEIEYRIREVEQLVPQQYVQEYYIDKYTEVPVTQIQEVERIEHVPVHVPPGYAQQYADMQYQQQQYEQQQSQKADI